MIKRRQLIDELNKFIPLKTFMLNSASQKKDYHRILINSILNRYNDKQERMELIDQRMNEKNISLTTHMSLKQALKKNKNMTRSLREARSGRAKRIREKTTKLVGKSK